jgi:hypothetical protein
MDKTQPKSVRRSVATGGCGGGGRIVNKEALVTSGTIVYSNEDNQQQHGKTNLGTQDIVVWSTEAGRILWVTFGSQSVGCSSRTKESKSVWSLAANANRPTIGHKIEVFQEKAGNARGYPDSVLYRCALEQSGKELRHIVRRSENENWRWRCLAVCKYNCKVKAF